MSLLERFFGRKASPSETADSESAAASAPGTRVHFHGGLIGELVAEHRELVKTFTNVDNAAKNGNLDAVVKYLEEFRAQLTDHLLKENVRLYVYIEHLYQNDGNMRELIHEFRREMNSIGHAVIGFLGKYRNLASQPALAASFASELATIGQVLTKRIQREESTLYSLYVPPR